MNDLCCHIYLYFNFEISDLERFLSKISFLKEKERDFYSNSYKIEVSKNHDYYKKDKTDDFLFYKYLLEIEPFKEVSKEKYISDLIELLNFFKSNNIKFVPSCDYEELLFFN